MAESAALLLLRRRRREVVAQGLYRGESLERIADRVALGMGDAIVRSRAVSRIAGAKRLEIELRSVGLAPGRLGALADEAARDIKRAASVARGYAERWATKAGGLLAVSTEQRGSAAAIRTAALGAGTATDGSLRRIGATESSEAFNTGRARYLKILTWTQLLRVWDATNDKHACPICSAADGTIVGVRESFPNGEPGAVHPFCRCSWTLLTAEESGGQTLIVPAA